MKWKKTIRWFALGIFALVALIVVFAAVVVRTAAFRRFVIAEIAQKLQESTGARLQVGSLALHLGNLSTDAYNIALHGSEPASEPPLFSAGHLGVGLRIVSVLRRKIELTSVVLEHPVFRLDVNARGQSNLPQAAARAQPASSSSSPVSEIFDLAIQHLSIQSGEVYYNNERIPFSAELHDLSTDLRFDPVAQEYESSLAYDRGNLKFGNFQPVLHALKAQLAASRSGVVFEQLVFTSGASRITARARLTNYRQPDIEGNYQAALFTPDLARILNTPSLPAGNADLDGILRYRSGGGSFLDCLYADGNLESSALMLRLSRSSVRATSIHAGYRLENGNLSVENAGADLLGGHVGGNFEMLHLGAQPASRLDVSVQDLSLESARAAVFATEAPIRLAGKADFSARAAWTRNIRDGAAHVSLRVSGPLQPVQENTAIAVNGNIDLDYDGARKTVSFGQSHLRTAATEISISGALGRHSDLDVMANTRDLREVSALVSIVQAANKKAVKGGSPDVLDLQGSAGFTGKVSGSTSNPEITGQLSASNLVVAGSRWKTLNASIDAGPSAIALRNTSLASAALGQITLNARVALAHWSFTPDSAITAQAMASRLSVGDLERLANLHYPVSGELSVNLSFSGSERRPSGHGTLSLTQAAVWDEPIQSLTVGFQGDGMSIRTAEQIRAAAGSLSANFNYSPMTREYEASINTTGLNLSRLRTIQERAKGIGGALTLSATGHGSLDDPHLDGMLEVASLQIRGRSIPQLRANVNIADKHATVDLDADLGPGSIQAKGDLALTGTYAMMASADVRQLPIGLLVSSYLQGGEDFLGDIDVHATVEGSLKDPAKMQAHVEIPSISFGYKSLRISNTNPLVVDYRDNGMTIQPTQLKGTGTDLTLQGAIPLGGGAALDISVKGGFDLASLKGLTPDLDSSGRVNVDLSAKGSFFHPGMQGDVNIVNATLSSASIPIGIANLNAEIAVSNDNLQIKRLSGSAGGGSISASGSMVYGAPASFNLSLNAKNVRMRYPQGVRTVLDTDLQLEGTSADSTLTGRALIDNLSFSKDFDMATLAAQLSNSSPSAAASPFESKMKLNLAIQSAQDLNAQSSQLSIQGSANLTLGGTLADPVLLGRMALTGGDVFFLGNRYAVQSGTIDFANAVRTEPILNLFLSTTVEQYDITLNFIGPLDRLKTNYTSTPSLPPSDIINLIAFGKTAEEQATETVPSTVGAESVIAQGVTGQITGRLQKLAGISQLTIDPLAGTNGSDPGSQFAIRQRITANLLLTVSTDVEDSYLDTVQLHYQATPAISVQLLRDQNGGYAMDIYIRKTF